MCRIDNHWLYKCEYSLKRLNVYISGEKLSIFNKGGKKYYAHTVVTKLSILPTLKYSPSPLNHASSTCFQPSPKLGVNFSFPRERKEEEQQQQE